MVLQRLAAWTGSFLASPDVDALCFIAVATALMCTWCDLL
jgi:hypothetical protein